MYDDSMLKHTLAHLLVPRHTNNQRPKIIHPEGFLVLTVIAFGFFVSLQTLVRPIQGILGYASNITPTRIIELTNKKRAELGVSALNMDPQLTAAAAAKASDMFNNQYWAHISPQGKTPWVFIKGAGYQYSVAGENLARDFGDSESVIEAWMNSPTHKENLLQGKYQDIGVAVVNGIMNDVETTLVVQEFGTKKGTTAKVSDNAAQTQVKAPVPVPVAVKEQTNESEPKAEVLSEETKFIIPASSPLPRAPLFSPLQLSKAFFLGMLLLLIAVLSYDMIVSHNRNTIRLVGKNLAHIALFLTVAFLVIFFKGGLTL